MTLEMTRFFTEKVPEDWFEGEPVVESDDEEILCTGALPPAGDADAFRESTRAERMAIAAEAEARFGRKVSWGVILRGATTLYTTQSIPVMSRLRFHERAVLDTLIDAGVARTRSEALSWCVKLVAGHERAWLDELREALAGVEQVTSGGPTLI
jgi:hypothetical protein